MNFDDLVKRLPVAPSVPTITAVRQNGPLVLPHNPDDGFVAPEISILEWPENSGVLLVEAPGAVGKTTTARELAHRLTWPLISAQRAYVGSYSLAGIVQDAFGLDSTYLQSVATGLSGLVVDALDEAQLKAGTPNFLAFLEDVRRVCGLRSDLTKRAVTIVLFARTDAAEIARFSFQEASYPLAQARLECFSQESAQDYISKVLARRYTATKRPEYAIAAQQPESFGTHRDEVLRRLVESVLRKEDVRLRDGWSEARSFIGYPPVLSTLAESLASMNPSAELAALQRTGPKTEVALLLEVTEQILEREQRKFLENQLSSLRASMPTDGEERLDSELIYSPMEQVLRIWAYMRGANAPDMLPAGLPSALRVQYEEAARSFVPDHPFVMGRNFSNVVFADYVKAQVSISLEAQAVLYGQERQVVDVGPFYYLYVEHLQRASDGHLPLTERVVESVLESWSLDRQLRPSAHLTAELKLDDDSSFRVFSKKKGAEDGPAHEMVITNPSGAFPLRRGYPNLTLVTQYGVILGDGDQPLSIGPGCFLVAQEVEIVAATLSAGLGTEAPSGIFTTKITANYLKSVAPGSKIVIVCDDLPPILAGFRGKVSRNLTIRPQDFIALRAILLSFRNTVHLGLCCATSAMSKNTREEPFKTSDPSPPHGPGYHRRIPRVAHS